MGEETERESCGEEREEKREEKGWGETDNKIRGEKIDGLKGRRY